MKSADIRRQFLDFFAARGHEVIPSASLVPADPTMLLTGAGMVPFKPIFLGQAEVDYSRATSVQKCVRTTDIELIGRTKRHLSFFEMLGNFSFGDYYKKEAIAWAWELLTEVYGLDASRLWVTIFEADDEAGEIWREEAGVEANRIVRLGADDNFWAAGPTGPCGPSSEILYDLGEELGCDRPGCAPGCDCDRYLEIWNLVFMQSNRDESGDLRALPRKNIDTGMGLERITSVLQGVTSNFETDLLKPLIDQIADVSGRTYGTEAKADISLRIIADHTRALTFMIGDGILPGNDGRGYILRRLIRRAVRHGRLIGIEEGFLPSLVGTAVEVMGGHYTEISENADYIKTVAGREEERFQDTLKQGLSMLNEFLDRVKESGSTELSSDAVFKLYDTYGFPLELTEEIADESGVSVDRGAFELLMEEQRTRARKQAGAGHKEIFVSSLYHDIKEEVGASRFIGYEKDEADAKIVAMADGERMKTVAMAGEEVDIVLDETPFYAEKGGQFGDQGEIRTESGTFVVSDTIAPVADLVVHKGKVTEGRLELEETVRAVIDGRRRRAIARNHTATHLLHWALRAVLGSHVKQAGSLVDADRFRFDFNHHEALTAAQLETIERLMNEKILQDQPVRAFETTIDFAKEAGALAFFGEKYGRFVRLVEIGNFSKELCGGVHVHSSSEVGYIKIVTETGIGADTRRIEAITGEAFLRYVGVLEDRVESAAAILKAKPEHFSEAVAATTERIAALEDELSGLKTEKLGREAKRIAAAVQSVDGISLYTGRLEGADVDGLRSLADGLRAKVSKAAVVLASVNDTKVLLLVAASPELVAAGFSSVSLVKEVAPLISGGGGGRPDLAQAGGKDPAKLPEVFAGAKSFLERQSLS